MLFGDHTRGIYDNMKLPSTTAAVTSVQAGSFGVSGLVPKSQSKNAEYNLTCHKNLFPLFPLVVSFLLYFQV